MALLRQVLALMGRHDAALTPTAFAVFYEHVAGLNGPLSAALQAQGRLDDAAVQRLYQDHVAEQSLADAHRIQVDMQRVMTDIAQSAAHTDRAAGAFGQTLDGLGGVLDGLQATLCPEIDAARMGTQAMRHSVQALQDQVRAGQREVQRLRGDLARSRSDALMCPLTGVLNRRGFEERLQAMLHQPPAPEQVHCLVLIDIDHFKRVNDEHGHPVGDRVLQGLGAVLRSVPAEPGMACARYGGEEFAILLPHTQLDTAVRVAEAVRHRTHGIRLRHRDTQAVACTITVSAGVAAWRAGDDPEALLAGADAALYRSKAQGRDRVMVA